MRARWAIVLGLSVAVAIGLPQLTGAQAGASAAAVPAAPENAAGSPLAAAAAPPTATGTLLGVAEAPAPAAPAPQAAAGAMEAQAGLTLPQAIELALAANPALAAARLARPVASANVAVAGERPNPDLLLERLRETPREAATLSLPIETAGKRQRRLAAAEADAASGEAEIARTTAATRNRVRRAFHALLAAQRRVEEQEASLALARRAAGAAGDRFNAGAAPRLDVLQAELAATQAANDADAARGVLEAARSDLNTQLGRPPRTAVTAVGDLLAAGTVPDADAAVTGALRGSTELALLDRRIAAQAARVDLARAQQVPNPTVQGALTHDAQPEFVWGWRAALSVTLPIFTRHRPEVEAEEAALDQLKAERAAAAAQVAGEVTSAVAQAAAARQQALHFRDDILPRAQEVAGLAEESYRAGETGLVALLQALQANRDLRLRAVQAGLDLQVALADLEQAIGAPLP